MGYIERFLKEKKAHKLSTLEKIALTGEIIWQFKEEIFNVNYRAKLKEDFFPEQRLVGWFDTASQSYIYKFFKQYFNSQMFNSENLPSKKGALLVANHSTIFLADVAPIYIGAYEKKRRCLYGLAFKMIAKSDILKTIGGVNGTRDLGMKLLKEDKLTLVCPGGILDACKPFYDSYLVKPVGGFSPEHCGYVKIAFATNKPIIPVAVIGAEETAIILGDAKGFVKKCMGLLDMAFSLRKGPWFNSLYELVDFAKVVPFLLNYLPLKGNIEAYVGTEINVREFIGDNPQQEDFAFVNQLVMSRLQGMIDKGLKKRKHLARVNKTIKNLKFIISGKK
ncbi:MAG: hypothetical protein U9Q69_01830 [Nanoarchaeota archaeon]|nr:hypothetical protein [Nanoarchaeota archaeon]